jgi:hypothetical protein
MSFAPEASRVFAAGFLGTVASAILLEIGLRTKSRRAWGIVVGCTAAILGWEAWTCTTYVRFVHATYLDSTYRIVGPSEWHFVWMQTEPYILTTVIPALVLRAVVARKRGLA